MTDLEFLDRAEQLLTGIEASCDRINDETEADIDNQRVGGMITMSFGNHSQIIVNLQKPLHEVWLAAKSGGYHYKWSLSLCQRAIGFEFAFSSRLNFSRLLLRFV